MWATWQTAGQQTDCSAGVMTDRPLLISLPISDMPCTDEDIRECCAQPVFTSPLFCRRLLSDDMKESGLLSVLSRLMRSFNAKLQPRSHAVDIIQVQSILHQGCRERERGKERVMPLRRKRSCSLEAPLKLGSAALQRYQQYNNTPVAFAEHAHRAQAVRQAVCC